MKRDSTLKQRGLVEQDDYTGLYIRYNNTFWHICDRDGRPLCPFLGRKSVAERLAMGRKSDDLTRYPKRTREICHACLDIQHQNGMPSTKRQANEGDDPGRADLGRMGIPRAVFQKPVPTPKQDTSKEDYALMGYVPVCLNCQYPFRTETQRECLRCGWNRHEHAARRRHA